MRPAWGLRSGRALLDIRIAGALYFASGVVALSLEILWFRALELVVGASAPAVAVLLSGYMGGLAAGAWLGGRWGWYGAGRPGRALAALHVLMGLTGVVLMSFSPVVPAPPWFSPAARRVMAFVVMVLVAAPVGGMFPVLAAVLPSGGRRAPRLALLYGLNVLGAATGTVLVSFFGLELLGARACAGWSATASVALAGLFLGTGGTVRGGQPFSPPASARHAGIAVRWIVIAFSLGFLGLGLQTAAVRALTPVMGLSIYALAGTVVPFLLGLGTGSLLAARVAPHASRWSSPIAASAAGLLALLPWVLSLLPWAVVWLADRLPPAGVQWIDLLTAQGLCAMVVLYPGAVALGALFPLVLAMSAPVGGPGGHQTGVLVAANTLGAVFGPVVVNGLLVGQVGVDGAYRTIAGGYVLVGAALLPKLRWRVPVPFLALAVPAMLLLVAAPAPSPLTVHSGVYWAAPRYAKSLAASPSMRAVAADRRSQLLAVIEGPTSTVLVVEQGAQRYLIIDGKPASNTLLDSPTQRMLARLPMSLKPDAKRVLVIGWGSGQTVDEILRYPVREVVCVEISPEVVRAAPWFKGVNARAVQDPRLTLVVDDARHFLASGREPFDVIVSQPSNPWVGFSWALFTREFLAMCRDRLAEGGLMVQWFQTYGTAPKDLAIFEATFASVFPEWSLWVPQPGDLLLLAPDRSRNPSPRLPAAVRQAYVGPRTARGLTGEVPLNTDDRPVLSFRTARHMLTHAVLVDRQERLR